MIQEVCGFMKCCFSRSPRTNGAQVHQEGENVPRGISEELSNLLASTRKGEAKE
ncbi:hypothetical protein I79_008801 [Cricetulus griseus]|uniref:Uncharacterized protein n=1 Tax=Cricetulus griseus TaxID=10029 RepID=G3HE30_CRIGR|nr:hypothetical protein I79_008801 [Cricetulus griseus]